ncbi:MAG: hypothetical protein ACRC9P_06845 [Bacteroides sp.]
MTEQTKTTKSAPKARMVVQNRDEILRPEELEILKKADGAYMAFVLKEMSDMVQLIRQGVDKETFDHALGQLEELITTHLTPAFSQLEEVQATRYEAEAPVYDGSTVVEE